MLSVYSGSLAHVEHVSQLMYVKRMLFYMSVSIFVPPLSLREDCKLLKVHRQQ